MGFSEKWETRHLYYGTRRNNQRTCHTTPDFFKRTAHAASAFHPIPAYFACSTEFQLPDHTQLPDEDGTFADSFQEHVQSLLLTDSINPLFAKHHPDGQYAIGQDCGIYWRLTDPPQKGAEAPDWFYVPNVPPALDGQMRRSYVLWKEPTPPMIVIEFVSGNGEEERDRTPITGKFWVYEQVIRPLYYAIYEVEQAQVELYHWHHGQYNLVAPNARGHYPIPPLGVELGIWPGKYQNVQLPWLRSASPNQSPLSFQLPQRDSILHS